MRAPPRHWRAALKAYLVQWCIWFVVALAGIGILMLGWDLFLAGYFHLATLTPLEALGLWILVGLTLVPVVVAIELLRSR